MLVPAVAILAFGSGIGSATLLLVAEFLPAALLGPFGGVLIDRLRLRSVLVSMGLSGPSAESPDKPRFAKESSP